MGEVRDERRLRNENLKQPMPFKNSFVLACIICLFSFLGLVCIYSASFPVAVNNGLNHYYFLLKQLIYLAIGTLLFIIVNALPAGVLKIISPISMFACIIILALDAFFKKSIILSPDTISFVFVAAVMYMSIYFSNRGNNITRLRQLVVPGLGCLLVLILLLIQKSFAYAFMFIGICSVMFIAGGVGVFGMLLLILYLLVPVLAIIFSKSDILLSVTRFIVPGVNTSERVAQLSAIQNSISSGSWLGKGLGMGEHKTGEVLDMAGNCIFANICEEVGLLGALILILIFLVFGFVGYRTAKGLRKRDSFYSNIALGCTTIILWQMIINITWVLGLIPGDGIPLPFFSYGLEIVPVMLTCGLLYKSSRSKQNSDDSKLVESIQDELMFPDRYEFEKV